MNLERKHIGAALIITLIPIVCFPVLFPSLRLIFFAPFLIILYYNKSYTTCLWAALACGLVMDILSSTMRLGLYGIDYCLTTWLLYSQRRHFFADNLSTLPIMTFFFSVLSTLIQLFLTNIFEQGISISWNWAATDLIYMPAIDAFYAFIVFILPSVLFGRRQLRGKDYFI